MFDECVESCRTEPLWLATKQTQSPHEAEDIMQEVFLKAMENSERFCTLQDGKSWLFKMTRNHFVDQLRRKIQSVEIEELSLIHI